MPLPYRIVWLDEAKGDVRRLDRATAVRLFDGILHYTHTGSGDVEPLHGDMTGAFRLRLGDYRVLFSLQDPAHLRRPSSAPSIPLTTRLLPNGSNVKSSLHPLAYLAIMAD
jgi:mRNA-degrading endonuclease RelE of RelBE toxin-antitoxin system